MRKFLVTMLVLFSLSLVFAGGDYDYKEKIVESQYFPDSHFITTRTTYIDYDNDDRYSTYDYRHGYSYRATVEYRDRYYGDLNDRYYEVIYDRNLVDRYYDDKYDHRYYYDRYDYKKYRDYDYRDYNNLDYYYEYIPHLREYQRIGCYHYPPADKLFYTKCPN